MPSKLYILILSCMLVSCGFAERFSFSGSDADSVVGRVGKCVLYRSELERLMPLGVCPEDSAAIAARIIERWKLEHLLVAKAEAELPPDQLDVSDEIESYRRSLLIYRFESLYVSERLDTVVTDIEIEDYYSGHEAFFRTPAMLVRGYFVKMDEHSPNLAAVRYNLQNIGDADTEDMEMLSARVSFSYRNFYDYWVSLEEFVPDFGMDLEQLTRLAASESLVESSHDGTVALLRIWERIPAGEVAPLDYCRETVRERILNLRKKELLKNLERDLLIEAVSSN